MEINFINGGKRYNREWIFKNFNYTFSQGAYVIQGGNGSGKSTLLKSILGFSSLSEGEVSIHIDGEQISNANTYKHFSICSPYLELYEELSLIELVKFHESLKPFSHGMKALDIIKRIELEGSKDKLVKYFSSGMKQRLRLGLAVLSDTKSVLLDEPISNLDRRAIKWYSDLIEVEKRNRIIIVASNNQEEEYFFCSHFINIEDFKKS